MPHLMYEELNSWGKVSSVSLRNYVSFAFNMLINFGEHGYLFAFYIIKGHRDGQICQYQ